MWPVEGVNLGCVGNHLWHNSVSNQHVVHLKLKVIRQLYLNKAGEKKSCVHDLQSCAVVLDLSSGQRRLSPLCLSVSGMWCKYLTGTNRSQCWRLESRFGAPCFQGCCRPPRSCPRSTAAGAAALIRRRALSLPSGRHHPVLFLVSLAAHCPLRNHLGT